MIQVVEQVISVNDFIRLRQVSGLSPRLYEAVEKGLPNSLFGVQIVINDLIVGMGRVVGDGALNFDIVDIAVDPAYQGRGFGRQIMQSIMDYLDREGMYLIKE
ncbi:GNAT family N-acetyltransferase [uncultured Shewanella sp.]|uniref:GNAT family N-acetyltransferase n=1 Tax=uncultured Shewanella sp. TaxID=173975 RepID=UPI002618F496|nr:GNAT family N-acetyltransferase [uncultured Shewanella sp.]